MSKSLETLSEIGDKVQEAAVQGRLRPDHPRRCGQEAGRQRRHLPGDDRATIIDEMRKLSTKNSAEIRDAVEDGKKRLARLLAAGETLPAAA